MGKVAAVRILPYFRAVRLNFRMGQHLPVPVCDVSPHNPVRIRILPCIVRTPYDVTALLYLEIHDISHHHQKQRDKEISDSSELFVPCPFFF